MLLRRVSLHSVITAHAVHAGNYRNLHAKLRDNAEPVAFYGGIEREGALITASFSELIRHRVRLLRTQWRFNVVQVCVAAGTLNSSPSCDSVVGCATIWSCRRRCGRCGQQPCQ